VTLLTFCFSGIAAFLLGSIPFGLVIGRLFYGKDIRGSGSGNIGAMNALRTLGTKGAVAVLLLDGAKGYLPVALALAFAHSPPLAMLAGIAAVLGHCFSPWLRGKGGKGVATSFGAILAMSWPAGVSVLLVWVVGALALTRYSSVGSMLANVAAPFALFGFTRSWALAAYGIFAAVLIVWTHRENLARLRSGTENRIGLTRKAS
jgi:acyl phosphate:glycerol-3-phosphate acyltransferase